MSASCPQPLLQRLLFYFHFLPSCFLLNHTVRNKCFVISCILLLSFSFKDTRTTGKKKPKQLLQRRSVSHVMNCRTRLQERRFFAKQRSCHPPCKQEVTVFLSETVFTQTFTEGKDQFNHLSTKLKGRRKVVLQT